LDGRTGRQHDNPAPSPHRAGAGPLPGRNARRFCGRTGRNRRSCASRPKSWSRSGSRGRCHAGAAAAHGRPSRVRQWTQATAVPFIRPAS